MAKRKSVRNCRFLQQVHEVEAFWRGYLGERTLLGQCALVCFSEQLLQGISYCGVAPLL